MTKKEVQTLLKNFKYKNFQFTGFKFHNGLVDIKCCLDLKHPRSGRKFLIDRFETFRYRSCDEMSFLSGLRDWIHLLEKHEADEFIFYKGKQIFHPHYAKYSLL